MKKKPHSISVLFMLVLFTVFAILSVLLIIIGSKVYGNIVESQEKNGNGRNILSYVTNKVRSCQSLGQIYIEEKDGVPVLVIGDEQHETLIFYKDGKLKEATISAGDDYNLLFGDAIAEVDNFTFHINKDTNMLKLTVDIDNKVKYIEVYVGAYR
jgi:hypothetical protein